MVVQLLNFLHRKGFSGLLTWVSKVMYFVKGHGNVQATYIPSFRAYSYRVKGTTFLGMGPGWAYHYEYLKALLQQSYNHYYMPTEGDCVVDIGAGLGEEAVIYSMMVGPKGNVHALEANPVTFSGLQYVRDQNAYKQMHPHHLAIYHSDGEVTIEDDAENYLVNTVNAGGSINVKAITLDSLIKQNNITRIDFLKCNVEGAEQFLIQGMDAAIPIIRNMCISCHDFRHVFHQHGEFYMTKEIVRAFLEKHFFEVTIRNTGNRVVDDYIYARNTKY